MIDKLSVTGVNEILNCEQTHDLILLVQLDNNYITNLKSWRKEQEGFHSDHLVVE